jgi:hypothetical protein
VANGGGQLRAWATLIQQRRHEPADRTGGGRGPNGRGWGRGAAGGGGVGGAGLVAPDLTGGCLGEREKPGGRGDGMA